MPVNNLSPWPHSHYEKGEKVGLNGRHERTRKLISKIVQTKRLKNRWRLKV